MKFFRYFFSKKEKYIIDGREVILISRTKEDFPPKLREIILIVCRTQSIAQHFPKLTFVATDFRKERIVGQIRIKDLLKRKSMVYINAYLQTEEAESYSAKEAEKIWRDTIIHELTHLLHESATKIFQKLDSTNQKLRSSLKRQDTSVNQQDHVSLRIALFYFIRYVFAEGIAVCYEASRTENLLFAERVFESLYRHASNVMYFLEINIQLYSTEKKRTFLKEGFLWIEKELKREIYNIGTHLVYSILFIDHKMTLEKIIQMEPFEFIRKYEACMTSKGLKPVISVTSGQGTFDYKKTLQLWAAMAKDLEKK